MTNTFVTYWKRQQAMRRRRNQRLTQVARRDLERITQALKDNYGSRFTVDLKPLEDLHPHFHRRVLAQGEIIYEAPDLG
jgi:hypothetical protein